MNLFSKLWADDAGVVTLEYLVLGTFLGLALIVGVATTAAALNAELVELSQAILSFSQTYSADGFTTCAASKEGSAATDTQGTVSASTPSVTAATVAIEICAP